jgi:hypothetical protein
MDLSNQASRKSQSIAYKEHACLEESFLAKNHFRKILLQAVDESLASIGESSKQAIYFHIEKSFRIRKEDIPQNIDVFANAIEKIFGVGADFLEILIMKRLHEKIKGEFELNNISELKFVEYVNSVQRSIEKTVEQGEYKIR